MSAVRAAGSIAREQSAPPMDVQGMQDALYDILATGIDPEQDVPSTEIERFLHEHARAAKPAAEFHAFFVKHGLSVKAQQPAAAVLELPPIARIEAEGVPVKLVREMDADADDPDTGSRPWADVQAEIPDFSARRRARSVPRALMLAVAACAVAALGVAGAYGYTAIRDMRAQLDRASQHAERDRQAIQALRDHAAGLESSVAATSELIQRVDQKSDLLLDTVLTVERNQSRKHH